MRVLVCGGRNFEERELVYETLDRIHRATPISIIIEGGARGADYFGALWSARNNLADHLRMSADWGLYGRSAGPLRNQKMLEKGKPDLVVAFPGGRGTADMVQRAKAAGVKVIEIGSQS